MLNGINVRLDIAEEKINEAGIKLKISKMKWLEFLNIRGRERNKSQPN